MSENNPTYKTAPTWVKFGGENHSENLSFLGKDILAIGQSSYVLFINTKVQAPSGMASYSIYEANGIDNHADGVACMATHGVVPVFAVAENKLKAQIYLLAYPSFALVSKMKCVALIGYQALSFTEGDIMVSLSQQPEFVLTIWNWICGEDLKTVKTETLTLNQQLRCMSNSPILISQSSEATNELKIWEVSICYGTCHVFSKCISMPESRYSSVCWAPEGILWFMNDKGDIYSIDPQLYTPRLFHSGNSNYDLENLKPSIGFYKTSLIATTPYGSLEEFKKQKGAWVDNPITYEIKTAISKLTSPIDLNVMVAWTVKGEILKVIIPHQSEEDKCLECPILCNFGEAIFEMCIINPEEEYLATVSRKELNIWKIDTGEFMAALCIMNTCTSLTAHPSLPIVVIGGNNGAVHFINLSTVTSPNVLCLHLLDHLKITSVTFDRTGTYAVAACLSRGTFFLLEAQPESENFYQVTNRITLGKEVASYSVIGSPSQPQLLLLLPPPKTQFTEKTSTCNDLEVDIEIDESGNFVMQNVEIEKRTSQKGEILPLQELLTCKISEIKTNGEKDEEERAALIESLKIPVVLVKDGEESNQVLSSYYLCLGESAMPLQRENEMYAFPVHSNKIHVLEIANKGLQHELKLVKILETGHQVRCTGNNIKSVQIGSMKKNCQYLLTFGADGIIFLHPQNGDDINEEPIILKSHHYINAGVRKAECTSTGVFVVSLGWDGCLVGTKIQIENGVEMPEETQKQCELSEIQSKLMKIIKTISPKDFSGCLKTWVELKAEEKNNKEMLMSAEEKYGILKDFNDLRAELNELMKRNEETLGTEKLPLEKFELDQEWRNERLMKGEKERQEEEIKIQNAIEEYHNKAEALRQECWEPMAVKGKCIKGVLSDLEVENYPLLPDSQDIEEKVGQAIERRTMEIELTFNKRFTPWMPQSDSYNVRLLQQGLNKPPSKSSLQQDERTRLYMAMMSTDDEDLDELNIKAEEKEPSTTSDSNMEIFEWSGSISHKFVTIPQCLHSQQLELYALNSLYNETILLEFIVDKLRKYFNTELEKTMEMKRQMMIKATGRIARLREIQSEHQWCLSALSAGSFIPRFSLPQTVQKTSITQVPLVSVTTIFEPGWDPREIPETGIMSVDDSEVNAIPYITPEEEAILAEKVREEEKLRKMREADNFRELALIEMMDGVLVVRWEDVIKKEVLRPSFMDHKDPSDWTEAEIKQHKEYETKVKFLQSERDRYRKLLEHEFETRNEDLMRELTRFDKSLIELHKLKLHVEASIIQENMKMIGMQLRNDKLNSFKNREKQLMKEISEVEVEEIKTDSELQELHQALRTCMEIYESITQKDKHLDQSFRKEGSEYASSVAEQRNKSFKRRPKNYPRSALSLALMMEVWRLHGCKPESWKENKKAQGQQKKADHIPAFSDLLLPEATEFLQALDTMDGFPNAFPGIDEDGWATLCKLRRVKLQNEIKAKITAHELAESENANKLCQKTLNSIKVKGEKLKEELTNVRLSKLELCHNAQVQLIMKNGNVEIDLTGSLSDFSDAILIHRSVIQKINEIITKTGESKIKAMRHFADFRRKVLLQEWEHKKLRMEIQDLVDQINLVEKTKVTKDMLELLATTDVPEKSPKTLDRDVTIVKEVYGKKFQDIQGKINELDTRMEAKEKENRKLDNAIRSINVDVNEQLLQCDAQLEHKYAKVINARLKALVQRSRLVNEIQEIHSDILLLQTELELLRLKTFPTFKYLEI